jgi:hypothetical protein
MEQSLLKKRIVAQLLKLLALHRTRRFITLFTRSNTGPYPVPEESTPRPHILFLKCPHINIIFLSMPWSRKWSLPFGFFEHMLHVFLICPIRVTCTGHLILFDLVTIILFAEACKLWSSSLLNFVRLRPPPPPSQVHIFSSASVLGIMTVTKYEDSNFRGKMT